MQRRAISHVLIVRGSCLVRLFMSNIPCWHVPRLTGDPCGARNHLLTVSSMSCPSYWQVSYFVSRHCAMRLLADVGWGPQSVAFPRNIIYVAATLVVKSGTSQVPLILLDVDS